MSCKKYTFYKCNEHIFIDFLSPKITYLDRFIKVIISEFGNKFAFKIYIFWQKKIYPHKKYIMIIFA